MLRWWSPMVMAAVLVACGGGTDAGSTDAGVGPDGGGDDPGGPVGPELVVRSVDGTSSLAAGDTITVTATVANEGTEAAAGFWALLVLTPPNAPDIIRDTVLDTARGPALEPAGTERFTFSGTLPTNLATGDYLLVVRVTMGEERQPVDPGGRHPIHVTGVSCAPDAFEDDDGPEQATSVELGVPQAHDFCLDPVDWLAVPVEAGRQYLVTSDAPVWVYDADGEEVWPDETDSNPVRLRWTADADEIHYLMSYPGMGFNDTGTDTGYEISVDLAE